jgi:Baseplate J-like protein
MNNSNNQLKSIMREGTRQADRYLPALHTDYVSVEERDEKSLITLAGKWSKLLQYITDENEPNGDWYGMFVAGADDISDYLQNPENYSVDSDSTDEEQQAQQQRLSQLNKPHLGLFLSFIRLLNHPKKELDALTGRHLEFFYQRILQLEKKSPVADSVHVNFRISSDFEDYLLPKDTQFDAGEDDQGNKRLYTLPNDILLNRASVASVKTLHRTEKYRGLDELRISSSEGFKTIFHWALGQDFDGDDLPRFPEGKDTDQEASIDAFVLIYVFLILGVISGEQRDQVLNYIRHHLHIVDFSDFSVLMGVAGSDGHEDSEIPQFQWELVYSVLERAHRQKWISKRVTLLRRERESNGVQNMLALVFGQSGDSNALPLMPSVNDTLDTLFLDLVSTDKHDDRYLLALRYIDSLGIAIDDFIKIMDVNRRSQLGGVLGGVSGDEWDEIYELLIRIESNMKILSLPSISSTQLKTLSYQSIAENIDVDESLADSRRVFPALGAPFGSLSSTDSGAVERVFSPGFAVASPLLNLAEGERSITLSMVCENEGFAAQRIRQQIAQQALAFDVRLGTADTFVSYNTLLNADVVSVNIDRLSQNSEMQYAAAQLNLRASAQYENSVSHGDYLILDIAAPDMLGLWRVLYPSNYDGFQNLVLEYFGKLKKRWSQQFIGRVGGGVHIASTPDTIDLAEASIDINNRYLMVGEPGYFSSADKGSMVVWTDTSVFEVLDVIDSRTLNIDFIGRLPIDPPSVANIYRTLEFSNAVETDAEFTIEKAELVSVDDALNFRRSDAGLVLEFDVGMRLEIVQADSSSSEGEGENISYTDVFVQQLDSRTYAEIHRTDDTSQAIEKFQALPLLKVLLNLGVDHQAIGANASEETELPLENAQLSVLIAYRSNDDDDDDDGQDLDLPFEYFADVRLKKAMLDVTVKGLSQLALRSDNIVLSANGPFEPFGLEPVVGSSLYFSHPELSQKKLETLSVGIEWADLPPDLEAHYLAYTLSGVGGIPETINNASFNAQMDLRLNGGWLAVEQEKPLFTIADADNPGEGRVKLIYLLPSSFSSLDTAMGESSSDPLEFSRHFRFSLQSPDFQHSRYPQVAAKVAVDDALQGTAVFPPYTPKIKQLLVDYTASVEIDPYALLAELPATTQSAPNQSDNEIVEKILHIHPFGQLDVSHSVPTTQVQFGFPLFPQFSDEGGLLIGFRDLQPNQIVNLLVQAVPGSASSIDKLPVLRFFCRTQTGWMVLADTDILSDGTNGLSRTGIISIRWPAEATETGPIMPQLLHWLKISAIANASFAAQIVDIRTQAAELVFMEDQLLDERPRIDAKTIESLLEDVAAIDSIEQPYASFGGVAAETENNFYARVSERVSHRNRASNPRDYERLALDAFANVAHAKCICHGESDEDNPLALSSNVSAVIGQSTVVVVPDTALVSVADELSPRFPTVELEKIETYLQSLASASAVVKVKNPIYQPVLYRLAVRFNQRGGDAFFSEKLNHDIQKMLSPWAFQRDIPVSFGGLLYQSTLIQYIESLSYVDYVASVKVFEHVLDENAASEQNVQEPQYQLLPEGTAVARRVDAILSSANQHIIESINEESFEQGRYKGIGYMIIGLDFVIASSG